MNTKRLNLMIKMLEEVKAGTWKVTTKQKLSGLVPNPIFDLEIWAADMTCGFSACAIGHAMLDKRFNKEGLVEHKAYNQSEPAFEGEGNFNAVTKFFEFATVSDNDDYEEDNGVAELLFLPGSYAGYLNEHRNYKILVEQIIRRIKYVMKNGEQKFFEVFEGEEKLLSPSLKPYNVRER